MDCTYVNNSVIVVVIGVLYVVVVFPFFSS